MRVPVCTISRDKLEEARFFVARLKASRGRQPAFRYYSSAALSASRSVTFVLQAEIRPLAEGFDDWWSTIRSRLADRLAAFPQIRDARNVVEKEGNRVLRPMFAHCFSEGPVAHLWLWPDPVTGVVEVDYQVRPGWETALNPLTEDSLRGLSREEVDQIIKSKVALTQDLAKKLDPSGPRREQSPRYQLLDGLEDYSFAEVIRYFETYHEGLKEVLDEADLAFGMNFPGLEPAT